jgi:hypothetical protein
MERCENLWQITENNDKNIINKNDGLTSPIGGPNKIIFKKRGAPNISVRLAYFHTNRLLIELNQPEKEIRCRKDDGPIKK